MTTIWITHEFPAIHYWPDAPEDKSYLRNPHRHLFKIRVEIEVAHDNRALEFITEKEHISNICDCTFTNKTFTLSCEQICDKLKCMLAPVYLQMLKSISVSEDDENGSVWYRD